MERIWFYIRCVGCWFSGGHDWKNILVVPPYRVCRNCGGLKATI